MITCELRLIKYILFIFNLIFAISGIGLIIAGSLVLSNVEEFSHFMESKVLAPPVVLIVVGVIVFLVASLGCYGAIRESYYLLMAYALCLLIIFIIEFAVGIAAASYKGEFQLSLALRNAMNSSLKKYDTSKLDKIAWDNVQRKLECCGVDGPNDWIRRPSSCCHALRENAPDPSPENCRNAKPGDDYLYNYGCFPELEMKAARASKAITGVGIGVAFIQIIGIILACWLASAVKHKDDK
ncbi:hypothetical protein NQ315_003737 [Exocentrus adspersus]|uniref:Tetraspanin n=1 Tax=Exocentrus adspersus TaxID=1586481 RepID=A0AAV8VI34_9CUCU|nr:hypothetical protein NQ315_003737 [Exocentrus adspersus]